MNRAASCPSIGLVRSQGSFDKPIEVADAAASSPGSQINSLEMQNLPKSTMAALISLRKVSVSGSNRT